MISIRISWRSPRTGRGTLRQRLEGCNVLSLEALRAFLHFKFHCLAFVERFISFHRDRGEMHENIFSRLALDESEALRSIKPLHCSLFLHLPASHAQLRQDRSRRYWNYVASLGPFPGDRRGGPCRASNESKSSTRATSAR